jgi:hypothetical protein
MLQRLKVASIAPSYRHYVAAYLAGRVHSLPSAASGLSEYEILKQRQANGMRAFGFLGVSFLELAKSFSTNVVAETLQGNSHCYDLATLSRCSIEVFCPKNC